MIPLRFGDPSRQLFGLHLAPTGGAIRNQGVLLCNPFGQEAIRCHRLFRVLGERLARDGYHVLRFDYYGTGDSDGDDIDADLDTWLDDVVRADEELLRLGGCSERSWFGLRFGATLAALASARAAVPPVRLVLWDPVVDGALYLEELSRSHAAGARTASTWVRQAQGPADALSTRGGGIELLGFPLNDGLVERMRSVSQASFAGVRARKISMLDSGTVAGLYPFSKSLGEMGIAVGVKPLETQILWTSDDAMNTAIVPAEALQAIAAALSEQ